MLVYLPAGADPLIPNPRPARAGLGGGQTRRVRWFDPVAGGGWQTGLVAEVPSDAAVRLGDPARRGTAPATGSRSSAANPPPGRPRRFGNSTPPHTPTGNAA